MCKLMNQFIIFLANLETIGERKMVACHSFPWQWRLERSCGFVQVLLCIHTPSPSPHKKKLFQVPFFQKMQTSSSVIQCVLNNGIISTRFNKKRASPSCFVPCFTERILDISPAVDCVTDPNQTKHEMRVLCQVTFTIP